jgi:hypothetical protein
MADFTMEQFLGVNPIDMARALLEEIRDYPFSGTTACENPYQLLSAVLTHALTPNDVAYNIIVAVLNPLLDPECSMYENFERLTRYYFNMFVMGIISLGF